MTPGHLAAWAQWMAAAGMADRTVKERVRLVAQFEQETGIDPVTADWRALAAFLADDEFKPGTRQTYYGHLAAWFYWLVVVEEARPDDPTMKIRTPKVPRRYPNPVTLDHLGRILDTRMHHRTRAMILLGAYEGFRVSEIAHTRGDHFDDDDIHVLGKGGVKAKVPVHALVAEIAATMPRRGLWFPSHTREGHPILGNSVSAIIKGVMERAGIPPAKKPHSLRHFFGTYVLRTSGGNLRVAQELMRHASVASTQLYTEVDIAERRAAVAALPAPPHYRRTTAA